MNIQPKPSALDFANAQKFLSSIGAHQSVRLPAQMRLKPVLRRHRPVGRQAKLRQKRHRFFTGDQRAIERARLFRRIQLRDGQRAFAGKRPAPCAQ